MKNRFLSVVLGCLLAVGSAGICADSIPHLAENLAYLKQLDAKLIANPNDENLLLQHAEMMGRLEKYDQEILEASQILKTKPQSRVAFLIRGQGQACLNQFDNAVQSYKSAFKLGEPTSTELITQATYLRGGKHFNEAVEVLTKVIRLEPRNSLAYYDRALNYFRLFGACKLAVRDLEMTIQIDPSNQGAKTLLADMVSVVGNPTNSKPAHSR